MTSPLGDEQLGLRLLKCTVMLLHVSYPVVILLCIILRFRLLCRQQPRDLKSRKITELLGEMGRVQGNNLAPLIQSKLGCSEITISWVYY